MSGWMWRLGEVEMCQGLRDYVEAPSSVLSDISPARGEIARVAAFPLTSNAASKRESRDTAISPLAGEMPTGREGRLAPTLP
jgi:hypothetical protein